METLGLPLEATDGNADYLHTDRLPGAKHFAIWPLAQANRSCFGTDAWPTDLRVPQFWLELDVADIAGASDILEAAGHKLLLKAKQEPWGQTVTRFLSPEGGLIGLTHTPWFREQT